MLHATSLLRFSSHSLAPLLVTSFCLLLITIHTAPAQEISINASLSGARVTGQDDKEPPYSAYKGVRIGMSTEEARSKLGNPKEKSDEQDFYVFSENEMAQVYYDKSKKVSAISVDYMGEKSNAPKPKDIVGTDVEAKPDGAMYKMVRYPKAGYWVSYSRTAGASPIVTVTIQKIS